MNCSNVQLYSPYGAYELKARYQRNLLTATVLVVVLVGVFLVTFYALGLGETTVVHRTRRVDPTGDGPIPFHDLRPQTERPVGGGKPSVHVKDGIPRPVMDDSIPPELDVILPGSDERGMKYYGIDTGWGEGTGMPDGTDFGSPIDVIPPPDSFIPVEKEPVMIYEEIPEYPRLARKIGLEGRIWVKALVDLDGTVMQAMVAKPSEMPMLEEAAVKAAYKNRFTPAIQNGRPVRVWVTYSVHFSLTLDLR